MKRTLVQLLINAVLIVIEGYHLAAFNRAVNDVYIVKQRHIVRLVPIVYRIHVFNVRPKIDI